MKYIIKQAGKIIAKNLSSKDTRFDDLELGKTQKYLDVSSNKFRRKGYLKVDDTEIFLCVDEAVDSTRIWKTKAEAILSFVEIFKNIQRDNFRDFTTTTDRLTHNLKKYNAHCIQASENILDPYGNTSGTKAQIDTIKSNITQDITKSSMSMFKIIKNNKLIQAELSVYDRLYKKTNEKPIRQLHSIHKLIRATLSAFWDSFLEKHINIEIENCYDEVYVDYETMTVVLVHLIENCSKYVCPKTTLNITFKREEYNTLKTTFQMLSLKIEESEKDEIYKEGYSGRLSCDLSLNGSGTGLYIIKEFINLNRGTFKVIINNNPSKAIVYEDIQYEENIFEICLPK